MGRVIFNLLGHTNFCRNWISTISLMMLLTPGMSAKVPMPKKFENRSILMKYPKYHNVKTGNDKIGRVRTS